MSKVQDIGSAIDVLTGNIAIDTVPATINGPSYDKLTYNNPESAVIHGQCGVASGSPTAQSVIYQLQDSADDSSFADVTGEATAALTADSTSARKTINLRTGRRYVRVEATVALTAGTTPAIDIASTLVLGGSFSLPTV